MKTERAPGSVLLDSDSLFSKFGFCDGDLLDDFLWDEYGSDEPVEDHAVLVHLVKKHLLPALPRVVKVYRMHSIHNPVRAEEDEAHDFESVSVWVTPDMIRAAVVEVMNTPTTGEPNEN